MVLSENDPVAQAQLTAFRKALQEQGWTEGRNVRFEVRWAAGEIERVRKYAAELVQLAPDVILGNGTPVLAALKQATRSIPIVFVVVNDPVAQGFISSVAHPGENITGFSFMDYSVIGKTLQLLKQIAPSVTRVGFMFNPDDYPYYEVYLRSFQQQRKALSRCDGNARSHRRRDRSSDHTVRHRARRGPHCCVEPVQCRASSDDYRRNNGTSAADRLRLPGGRRGRRADVLRTRPDRHLPTLSILRRSFATSIPQ
jgi:hypothetical protein